MKEKLINICNPKQWKTLSTSELIENGIYNVYGANGIIGKYNKYNHEEPVVTITCRGATCGNVHITNPKAYVNGNAMCLDNLNENICLKKYLYYYLQNYNMKKVISGSAQPQITVQGLSKIEIKLYDINIQQKIIKKFEKIEELIEIRRKQIDNLDGLIKSQFVEMFGDIENTGYDVYKLSELANLITDGEHKKPKYKENGTPFISVVNITTGELKFENCKFVSEEDACKFNKRCKPEKDDVLYTKVGATYGRSAIVDTDTKFALYVSVCLIKPKKDLLNPIFLNYTMRQPYVKSQADKCIKGIGVPDLHLIEIKNFKIILPPIEEQNQFAEIVKKINKQKVELQKSLEEIKQLQESLMDKYF